MRRKAQEIKDKTVIEKILKGSQLLHLAMIDDNRPYILPLNYGYKDNYIYIHCALKGKKIDILRKNNNVAFEIVETAEIVKNVNASEWTTKYRSVVGSGEIEILEDYDQKVEGLEILMEHFGGPKLQEVDMRYIDALLILKLKITALTGKKSKVFEI